MNMSFGSQCVGGGRETRLEMQGVRGFPKFDNPRILQAISMKNCKDETDVSKLSGIKTIVEESLDYFSTITVENDITKYLSYEQTVKEHEANMQGEKRVSQMCAIMLCFWI